MVIFLRLYWGGAFFLKFLKKIIGKKNERRKSEDSSHSYKS